MDTEADTYIDTYIDTEIDTLCCIHTIFWLH